MKYFIKHLIYSIDGDYEDKIKCKSEEILDENFNKYFFNYVISENDIYKEINIEDIYYKNINSNLYKIDEIIFVFYIKNHGSKYFSILSINNDLDCINYLSYLNSRKFYQFKLISINEFTIKNLIE